MLHMHNNNQVNDVKNQLITFQGQGSKDRISLTLSRFLYGKAQDNYVEIYYREKEVVQKFLMRSSLGKLVESLTETPVRRSHRSFMVNLYHVTAVKGVNSDMKLILEGVDDAIPVSRSYKNSILNHLKELKELD